MFSDEMLTIFGSVGFLVCGATSVVVVRRSAVAVIKSDTFLFPLKQLADALINCLLCGVAIVLIGNMDRRDGESLVHYVILGAVWSLAMIILSFYQILKSPTR